MHAARFDDSHPTRAVLEDRQAELRDRLADEESNFQALSETLRTTSSLRESLGCELARLESEQQGLSQRLREFERKREQWEYEMQALVAEQDIVASASVDTMSRLSAAEDETHEARYELQRSEARLHELADGLRDINDELLDLGPTLVAGPRLAAVEPGPATSQLVPSGPGVGGCGVPRLMILSSSFDERWNVDVSAPIAVGPEQAQPRRASPEPEPVTSGQNVDHSRHVVPPAEVAPAANAPSPLDAPNPIGRWWHWALAAACGAAVVLGAAVVANVS